MRVAIWILVLLVFVAGLVFDTTALLELTGDFLWQHAVRVGVVVLGLAAAIVAWRRLRRGAARMQAAPRKRASASSRKPRAAGTRKRDGGAKRA